jgi:hypothetical protein
MGDCRHELLVGLALTRCAAHSNEHVDVWTWHDRPLRRAVCPCVVADRFLVVHERMAGEWLPVADVVVADPQPDLRTAFRVALTFEHAVTVLPVRGAGIVFRSPRMVVRNAELCGVCVYPWLVTTKPPACVALGQHAAHRSPRTDQEPV